MFYYTVLVHFIGVLEFFLDSIFFMCLSNVTRFILFVRVYSNTGGFKFADARLILEPTG